MSRLSANMRGAMRGGHELSGGRFAATGLETGSRVLTRFGMSGVSSPNLMPLGTLGPASTPSESDLEPPLRQGMESFRLDVGRGWRFLERQKRMASDGDDYYLGRPLFPRPPRR